MGSGKDLLARSLFDGTMLGFGHRRVVLLFVHSKLGLHSSFFVNGTHYDTSRMVENGSASWGAWRGARRLRGRLEFSRRMETARLEVNEGGASNDIVSDPVTELDAIFRIKLTYCATTT
jgi:hypothetical protein